MWSKTGHLGPCRLEMQGGGGTYFCHYLPLAITHWYSTHDTICNMCPSARRVHSLTGGLKAPPFMFPCKDTFRLRCSSQVSPAMWLQIQKDNGKKVILLKSIFIPLQWGTLVPNYKTLFFSSLDTTIQPDQKELFSSQISNL